MRWLIKISDDMYMSTHEDVYIVGLTINHNDYKLFLNCLSKIDINQYEAHFTELDGSEKSDYDEDHKVHKLGAYKALWY